MNATPRQPDRTPRDATPATGVPALPTPAAGTPVNPFSRVVSPRKQFPLHYDLLMHDLFAAGVEPERWLVIAAEEVRLDEDGMDVEFTLVETATNRVQRSRVEVQQGRLRRIRHS